MARTSMINAFTYWDGIAVDNSSQMLEAHLTASVTHIRERLAPDSKTQIMIGGTSICVLAIPCTIKKTDSSTG